MWLGLLTRPATGSLLLQSGTRTSEGPRGRRVRLVELDVAPSTVARRARSRRAQEVGKALRGRVIDDHVGSGLPQPDVELIVDTWFTRVSGLHDEVDVTEQVRSGRTTNATSTDRPAFVVGARVPLLLRRDAGPVNGQAVTVVAVL